jgi:coniferyl-aldehyde dehydrogenase
MPRSAAQLKVVPAPAKKSSAKTSPVAASKPRKKAAVTKVEASPKLAAPKSAFPKGVAAQANSHSEIYLGALLAAQQEAFLAAGAPSASERREKLKLLSRAVVKYQDRIVTALAADFSSRAKQESVVVDVLSSLESIKYNHDHLEAWMKPQRRMPGLAFQPASAKVHYQPLGVIGIISPWNYPVHITLSGLSVALAAGNRVMLKLSEHTPQTSAVLAEMIESIFRPDEVAVVQGDAAIGVAFSKLPFDHLLFTGGTAIGRHVMRAAAENLVPVTLELGGKSPALIHDSADMADVAGQIAAGKLFNAGQTCIAPDYVLVPKSQVAAFTGAYTEAVRKMFPKLLKNQDYTAIINPQQYDRLNTWLKQAELDGARIQTINPAGEKFPASCRKIPPTLVFNVSDETPLGREEIFGPILLVIGYDSLEQAVQHVNSRPRPLALYVFSRDEEVIERVLHATIAGGVTVNGTLLHYAQDDLPFGGVGASGIGAYHGEEGFRRFSHAKAVFRQPLLNATPLLRPPYGMLINAALSLMIRRASL